VIRINPLVLRQVPPRATDRDSGWGAVMVMMILGVNLG
jgi:hypothetical protein